SSSVVERWRSITISSAAIRSLEFRLQAVCSLIQWLRLKTKLQIARPPEGAAPNAFWAKLEIDKPPEAGSPNAFEGDSGYALCRDADQTDERRPDSVGN